MLTDSDLQEMLELYRRGTLSLDTIRELFNIEPTTQTAIMVALSLEDIGLKPADEQFAAADRVLSGLKSNGTIKVYDLKIERGPKGDAVSIGWSKMLKFPSQTFRLNLAELTRDYMRVRDVMES